MKTVKNVTKLVVHRFNGFADELFIEIDGKKFIPNETDPSKAKVDDAGNPVPFVELKKEENKSTETKGVVVDYKEADIDALAKINPHVAALLDSQKKRDEADAKAIEEKKKEDESKAEKDGEWQKLATTRSGELDSTKSTLKQKEDILGKYVETTEKVLKGLLDTIPKENLSLIPSEFSPRQKLEYIIINSARLGAKVNAMDGRIDKSDLNPQATDEDKLIEQIKTLTEKGALRTSLESQNLMDAGIKLTEVRRAKAAAAETK